MKKVAIVTGANGDMGREITKAIAKAGYITIMACFPSQRAEQTHAKIQKETNGEIVLLPLDLASQESIFNFVEKIANDYPQIDLLVNNAGVLYPKQKDVEERWDYTTMVNYFGHYILTTKLLPLFHEGGRIINVVSLTYRFGKIEPQLFEYGRNSWVQQVQNYSNSKLALLYFSLDLAEQLKEKNITVNCSDPGIVGTKIIAMNNNFFDKICDVFARPFMKSPKNGAKTAIYLALDGNVGKISGEYFENAKKIPVLSHVLQNNEERELLRKLTQDLLHERNILI
ncbi:MAG: SDR family NAD(P)-dependent oxidoreductase [Bacteroidetes bacterium]|nr:SDR family NAD(P)-dependent oxidoreductase [Bacteroidota bacterium]MCL2301841.1 SDR family NAD(P)-dependent oxidoreductase [Lentimicrobiaceae bacterium]